MDEPVLAERLRRLSSTTVLGHRVRVARGFRARLLGLAFLDRRRAGGGLLIPRCASVHTFGMRFALDVFFLDDAGVVIAVHCGVASGRVLACRGAAAALELPSRRSD